MIVERHVEPFSLLAFAFGKGKFGFCMLNMWDITQLRSEAILYRLRAPRTHGIRITYSEPMHHLFLCSMYKRTNV